MASQKKKSGCGEGELQDKFLYSRKVESNLFFFVRRLGSAKEEGRNERDRTGPRGVWRV